MKNFFTMLILGYSCHLFGQDQPAVNFEHLKAEITILPDQQEVRGDLKLRFDVLKSTDSVYIDAKDIQFSEVLLNDEPVTFSNSGTRLWLISDFTPSEDQELHLEYSARPEKAMYFIPLNPHGTEQEYQVWTQGQGKETSHWLPSFDDPQEKVEFDLSIRYKPGRSVIANGVLKDKERLSDSLLQWNYEMQAPMSSYLLAIVAGQFDSVPENSGNVPLLHYYPVGKRNLVEPTYRYTRAIMDYLEATIGVPFPWQIYKQVPVREFLYAGMENTGTTVFSDALLVDSIGFNDRNYVNVNAHEMAHQWFGNLVTAKSPEHHWLQEGLSTYYALLAEREIFGKDYFYWKLFQTAEELKQASDSGEGEALVSSGASSLTYYQKGAWALHVLSETIGEKTFHKAVASYLRRNRFSTATTSDLIQEMERASGKNLDEFVENWLVQSAFQGTQALEYLRRSSFIQEYLKVAALRSIPIEDKQKQLSEALDFPVNDYIGQEAVHQLAQEPPATVIDLYRKAFETHNLYVRQAIALSLTDIPVGLRPSFETLLEDSSYVTQESAFYHLWRNFPSHRKAYFKKMKGREGFQDKNIETLWLALKIATPETAPEARRDYLSKLREYTAPHHRYQLRQNAFRYLFQLGAFDQESRNNLEEATKHHVSRFRNFAREILEMLTKQKEQADAERP